MMINETIKNKTQVVNRILNHALGIIYLLTGEEYIVAKKTSSHSSDHLVTGEVPVKCGDISVYFSMEEWDFIEGHKEIYKDLVSQNRPPETTAKIPGKQHRVPSENLIRVSSGGKEEDEESELDIEQVQISSDTRAGDAGSDIVRVAEIEKPGQKRDLDSEKDSSTYTSEITIIKEFGESQKEFYSLHNVRNASVSPKLQEENFGEREPVVSLSSEIKSIVHYSLPGPDEQKQQTSNEIFVDDFNDVTRDALIDTRNRDRAYLPNFKHLPASGASPAVYDEKPYPCHACGKMFPLKSRLLAHQKKHKGQKPFQCSECGKEFTSHHNLIVHQRTHPGEKLHECTECGQHFSSKPYLIEHLRTHVGLRPHTCNRCGKQFPYKSYLAVHLRSHNGGKPHRCADCGKDFDYRSRLLVHQRTHTGLKPHVCHICGKSFDYKSYLSRHLKTHGIAAT